MIKKDAARLQKEFFTYKKSSHFPIEEMLFPDVKVVLQRLSETKLKIGLATSSSHEEIAEVLDTHNLRKYFEVISSGEDFPESKPHPAIYLSAMKQLNARASDVLVIEDSPMVLQREKQREQPFGRLEINDLIVTRVRQTDMLSI